MSRITIKSANPKFLCYLIKIQILHVIDVPTLTANTWTKITQSLPSIKNQVYNNDNGTGLEIQFSLSLFETDYTACW